MGATDDLKKKTESVASEATRIKEDVKEKLGMKPKEDKNLSLGLLFFRLGLSMFVIHGFQKLTGLAGTEAFFGSLGIPAPGIMAIIVGLVEFLGGLSMLLGIGTRVSGPLLSIVMLVAIVTAKLSKGWPSFELDLAFLTGALGMTFAGPGMYSLAAKLGKGKKWVFDRL